MKIAIASGKGGTGKSTVSTNLAYLLSKTYNDVALLDCDVEEPNCHIFMKPDFNYSKKVCVPIPEINTEKCIACGKCAEVCQYNALAFVKGKVLVFGELCHGCGSCGLVCPVGAISEKGREVGVVEAGFAEGFNFIHGKSRIGEAMSPPLIKAVKKADCEQRLESSEKSETVTPFNASNQEKRGDRKIQILDCPPGTSCPVIAAVNGADFVVMVTEPTPFGLYDLKLAVDVIRKIGLPFGVVINRSCENDSLIENWAKEENINILTKIPDDRRVAECYSKGELVLKAMPEFKKYFEPLVDIVREAK